MSKLGPLCSEYEKLMTNMLDRIDQYTSQRRRGIKPKTVQVRAGHGRVLTRSRQSLLTSIINHHGC